MVAQARLRDSQSMEEQFLASDDNTVQLTMKDDLSSANMIYSNCP